VRRGPITSRMTGDIGRRGYVRCISRSSHRPPKAGCDGPQNGTPRAPQTVHRYPSRSKIALRVRCQVHPSPPRAALFRWSSARRLADVHRAHLEREENPPQSRQRRRHPTRRWRRCRNGQMRRRMAAGSDASPTNTLLNRRMAPHRRHLRSATGRSGSVSRQWRTHRPTAEPR